MPGNYKAAKLPVTDVDATGVATQQNVEAKRVQNAINRTAGLRIAPRTITASASGSSTDGLVYADTTAGVVNYTLTKANQYMGLNIGFKKIAGGNAFTVTPYAGDTLTDATPASVGSITITGVARYLHVRNTTTWEEV